MTDCKYLAIIFLVVVSCTLCFATNKRCFWVIDAVDRENLSKVASVIGPGGQYFLRIRIKCDNKVSGLMHVDFNAIFVGQNMKLTIKLSNLKDNLNRY